MTVATPETFKASWIASLKAQPSLVALVGDEIRETEYQSIEFVYPSVRVSVEFRPSLNRCGPDDATVMLEVFSEEKSSKQAAHIASLLYELYQGKPFEQSGIRWSTVVIRKVSKPERDVPAWRSDVEIFAQGVGI